ncbi:HEAT repeat domain-containing protein [Actinomadura kijaniata]|uniref:HEAT repeat domain-containing protein n=1 Tax=Actinomadura kijaniata TaxID=46161 RepID=UPI000836F4DA|nr:HEAT repeat domain-containing protein [Actinomadura kijaniata]
MDEAFTTAARTGDVAALWRLPAEDLSGDEGAALLRAALLAGDGATAEALVELGADPSRPWADGTDALTWAADRGDCEMFRSLLTPASEPGWERRVLPVARRWFTVDVETELRRRLGDDGTATAERSDVLDEYGEATSVRVRVTTADGRGAEACTGHRGIVTFLERLLGVPVPFDELVDRALFHARPGSSDWYESTATLSARHDHQTLRRLAALAEDPSVDRRRLAADTLRMLSLEIYPEDGWPHAEEARELARRRCRAERDPLALGSLVAAFAEFSDGAEANTEILRHADHPDPGVRCHVAASVTLRNEPRPHVRRAVTALADDPDGDVRRAALVTIVRGDLDDPRLLDVLAAHLDDPYLHAAYEAVQGLALHRDARCREALDRIRNDPETTDHMREMLWYASERLDERDG